MKKKWLSVLAMAMCFTMASSVFVGCGGDTGGNGGNSETSSTQNGGGDNGGNGGSENGGNGGGENGGSQYTPLSQDEVYEEIMKAMATTGKYSGALTMEMTQTEEETLNGETEKMVQTMKATMDPATKLISMDIVGTQTYGETTSTRGMTNKIFYENGNAYMYSKSSQGEQSMEQYQKVTDAYVDSVLDMDTLDLSGLLEEFGGFTKEGVSVDALNAAFAETFATSKAEIEAEAGDESSKWYQCSADGSCVITCTDVNGVYTMTLTLDASFTEGDESESMLGVIKVVATGGYLTEFVMIEGYEEIYYEAPEDDPDGTPVKQEESDMEEVSFKIAYGFSQADYDAIVTTLPAEVPEMEEDNSTWYGKDVDVVINGVKDYNDRYISGDDFATAISSFLTNDYYGYYTVTWYTDEACTQALTTDITKAQMDAINVIYGKATAKSGSVLLIQKSYDVYAEDVPEAYKMAYNFMGMMGSSESMSGASVEEGIWVYQGYNRITKVNGEEVTFAEEDNGSKQITLVEGETYTIEYLDVYTKADLNIFSWYF